MVCRVRTFRFSIALLLAACSGPTSPVIDAGGGGPGTSGAPCKAASQCQTSAGFSCTLGVCSRACSDTQPCGNNEVCGELGGKKRCLSLCDGDTCAAGSACQTFWPTRQRVCAQAPLFGACRSVMNVTPCTTTTCSQSNFTSICEDGRACPSNSTCGITEAGGFGCYCEPGFDSFLCDGTRCAQPNGSTVCDNNTVYSCNATELIAETCTTEPHGSAGTCQCADGRLLPFICGETDSCEQRCATGCNYAASDCPEQTKKCGLAFDVPGDTMPTSLKRDRPVCTDLLGNRQRGETCRRVAAADGGLMRGRDDCGLGLVCDTAGEVRGEPRCHKICSALTVCAAGETCAYSGLTFPPAGVCVKSPGCTIGGTECGPGKSCTPNKNISRDSFSYCKFDGIEDAGSSCTSGFEDAGSGCGTDLSCRSGKCKATCSPQKPCISGTCRPYGWGANDPGSCE